MQTNFNPSVDLKYGLSESHSQSGTPFFLSRRCFLFCILFFLHPSRLMASDLTVSHLFRKCLDIFACQALFVICHLLRCSCRHNPSSGFTAAGSHINDIIRIADHIQIMFDHNHRCPMIHQCLKDMKQCLNIQRMQPYGRFIKDKYRISLASFNRCASPPERLGVSSPRVRYPRPRFSRTTSR